MTTTPTQQPESLRLADALKMRAPYINGVSTIDQTEKELCRQHAEIERLTAENKALRANIELIDYVLQDDIHNRLTPRVVDIAYSAFTFGRRDTPHDWFNDTKPMVMEQLVKIQKHLAEEAASRSDMADAYCGAREDLANLTAQSRPTTESEKRHDTRRIDANRARCRF